jgi:3-oxoacyl-[acyl-carrier protein] reductase
MSSSRILTGKVALITGCNRGIGKSILTAFASNGADIWACARKPSEEFVKMIDKLSQTCSVEINPMYFDLSNEAEIKANIRELYYGKNGIDILVNNAGISHGSFIQMTPINQVRQVFEVNFFSQLLLTQLISKIMLKLKHGNIINISSIAGIDPSSGNIAYGSSKAALIYATKVMAREFAPYIRVNAIAPGLTGTAMAEEMEKKAKENMIHGNFMNRLAEPDEIANTALFLASDQSSFVNGQVLRVDGGI